MWQGGDTTVRLIGQVVFGISCDCCGLLQSGGGSDVFGWMGGKGREGAGSSEGGKSAAERPSGSSRVESTARK